MKNPVSIVAAVLLAATICRAQTELPDKAAKIRTLRDHVIGWSQHLTNRQRDPIDAEVLGAVADYLDRQQWPDPEPGQRKGRIVPPLDEWSNQLDSASSGLKWLARGFAADRPEFVAQVNAAIAGLGERYPHNLHEDDESLDLDAIELKRWHKEWKEYLDRSQWERRYTLFGPAFATSKMHEVDREVLRCVAFLIDAHLHDGEFDRAIEIARATVVANRSTMFSGIFSFMIGLAGDGLVFRTFMDHADAMTEDQLARLAHLSVQMGGEHYLAMVLTEYIDVFETLELAKEPNWEGYEDYPLGVVDAMRGSHEIAKALLVEYMRAELEVWKALVGDDANPLDQAKQTLASKIPAGDLGKVRIGMDAAQLLTLQVWLESFSGGMTDEQVSALANLVAHSRSRRLVIALHRHKLAHGGWPESLDAFVPAYLDELPMDPHDPERGSIRYRVNEDGSFTLWSVGPDGTDNGGAVDPESPYSPGDAFDLVLWPA